MDPAHTLDSLIQLSDPERVSEPKGMTDGQRTLTGTPARNPSSSTVLPPGTTSNADLASAMALLAQLMAKSNSTPVSKAPSSGSRVREPDQFDGSDPRKLRPFLFQCQLNFHDRPAAFVTDSVKVNYMVSFLRGTALDYFEAGLSAEVEPTWLSHFPTFRSELQTHFGPYDPFSDTEAELEQLVMKDNHCFGTRETIGVRNAHAITKEFLP